MKCGRCGAIVQCGDGPVVPFGQEPVTREFWPGWATAIERYRRGDDTGVGDTAKRIFARLGGEVFKWLAEKLGMPCGCSERQAEWNRLYPYR